MSERLGVFGGTFDPPHAGHLVAASEAHWLLGLDRVLLVVANQPWQKSGARELTDPSHRLVRVGSWRTLDGLVDELGPLARRMVEAFWPGPLTLVVRAAPSLAWDLGETRGTVAVRMPQQQVALDILTQTGPLAVSSANRSGLPPEVEVAEAEQQLGEAVRVYLDAGPLGEAVPSTIVDLTGNHARVLRSGALDVELLRELAPDLEVTP